MQVRATTLGSLLCYLISHFCSETEQKQLITLKSFVMSCNCLFDEPKTDVKFSTIWCSGTIKCFKSGAKKSCVSINRSYFSLKSIPAMKMITSSIHTIVNFESKLYNPCLIEDKNDFIVVNWDHLSTGNGIAPVIRDRLGL